jgi:hypothetical protein
MYIDIVSKKKAYLLNGLQEKVTFHLIVVLKSRIKFVLDCAYKKGANFLDRVCKKTITRLYGK